MEGATATITTAGTYVVQGTLADGQVKVDAGATAKVKLILNGVNITTSDDAPIFVKNAAKEWPWRRARPPRRTRSGSP